MKTAIGYSEDIEDSFNAGLEIGNMILQQIDLCDNAVGILFCDANFDFKELLKGIRKKLPIPLIGCTTAGEINTKGCFDLSASLMVITGDDIKIGVGLGTHADRNSRKAVQEACETAHLMLGSSNPRLAITFPDTIFTLSTDYVLNMLMSFLGEHIPIIGGIPGDNFQFKQTYQFLNDAVYSNSIPLLLLAGDINPVIVTGGGWRPIGQKVKVTKAEGNILYEIDHQPAIEYLKRYIHDISTVQLLFTKNLITD